MYYAKSDAKRERERKHAGVLTASHHFLMQIDSEKCVNSQLNMVEQAKNKVAMAEIKSIQQ